jgi:hypothetical protein
VASALDRGYTAISIRRTSEARFWGIGGLDKTSGLGMEWYFNAESIRSDFPELRMKGRQSARESNHLKDRIEE